MRFLILCSIVSYADTGADTDTGSATETEVGFDHVPMAFDSIESSVLPCLRLYSAQASDSDYHCTDSPTYDDSSGACHFDCDLLVRITPDE